MLLILSAFSGHLNTALRLIGLYGIKRESFRHLIDFLAAYIVCFTELRLGWSIMLFPLNCFHSPVSQTAKICLELYCKGRQILCTEEFTVSGLGPANS